MAGYSFSAMQILACVALDVFSFAAICSTIEESLFPAKNSAATVINRSGSVVLIVLPGVLASFNNL